jgi:DNA-binding response OmpR family regulator
MPHATNKAKLPATPWGYLPPSMRVLFITGSRRTGFWLAEALAADGASDVQLEEARGVSCGMARLRDEAFEAVLISHEPGELDALELLDAVRAGSTPHQPIVVLGNQSEQEMTALCFEAGADAYVHVGTSTVRTLIWHVARAAERQKLISENQRLAQAQRHRLRLEHEEADRLLSQQRALVASLERIHRRRLEDEPTTPVSGQLSDLDCASQLPAELALHYRELLRAYVIMGSGRLAGEMNRLAEMLVSAGVTAQQTMHLHLRVLEEMVQGLGYRSARHVMNRADLLVLEVMLNLAEQYRRRCRLPSGGRSTQRSVGLDLEHPAA